jgi:hypothetical protein
LIAIIPSISSIPPKKTNPKGKSSSSSFPSVYTSKNSFLTEGNQDNEENIIVFLDRMNRMDKII